VENKSHALMAGLFTVLLGIALIAAALWLSRDTQVKRDYELVTKGSVSGLSPQSDVRYRGLEVGKVESISFRSQGARPDPGPDRRRSLARRSPTRPLPSWVIRV
jgi:ABC-type transporter Mla subunit MlaD